MIARHGAVEVYFDTFGDPTRPTLLMVNGLGSQCINYPDEWCELFAAEGLHVVRYDNRDVGLSSKFDQAPTGAHGEAYLVSDMVHDGIAVLDTLGVAAAHVMGLSMGGMIVQNMAILASGSWAERLPDVTAPTLVLHGDHDTLIDQIGGRRTAELIPGARFELIAGMGHDYPPQLWRRWTDLVAGHIRAHS